MGTVVILRYRCCRKFLSTTPPALHTVEVAIPQPSPKVSPKSIFESTFITYLSPQGVDNPWKNFLGQPFLVVEVVSTLARHAKSQGPTTFARRTLPNYILDKTMGNPAQDVKRSGPICVP